MRREARAAVAIVAHTSAFNLGSAYLTTSAINTIGATLLVVAHLQNGGYPIDSPVTDSKGNTWHSLTLQHGSETVTIWYAWDHGGTALSVGSGHTATVTPHGGSFYTAAVFAAYSGTLASGDPFDVENGESTGGEWIVQPGAVTPSQNGSLVITACESDYQVPYIYNGSDGFTDVDGVNSGYNGSTSIGVGNLIQSTAAPVNPQWALGGHYGNEAVIAVFKPASGGSAAKIVRRVIE
jgi:hypothetical protein